MTVEEIKTRIAELEAKDELTAEEADELKTLKESLPQEPTDGGSLNIGG